MRELRKRDCTVMVCRLPLVDGVNGPDDLIAVRGDDAMQAVFDGATANDVPKEQDWPEPES